MIWCSIIFENWDLLGQDITSLGSKGVITRGLHIGTTVQGQSRVDMCPGWWLWTTLLLFIVTLFNVKCAGLLAWQKLVTRKRKSGFTPLISHQWKLAPGIFWSEIFYQHSIYIYGTRQELVAQPVGVTDMPFREEHIKIEVSINSSEKNIASYFDAGYWEEGSILLRHECEDGRGRWVT